MVFALGTEPLNVRDGLADSHAFETVEFGLMGLELGVVLKRFFISKLILLFLEQNDSSSIIAYCK